VTGGEPVAGCACTPLWADLVVHTETGDIAVEPAATPGGLACLYQAWCARCGAVYPGPFRVPPRASTSPACRAVRGATTSPRWSNRVHPTESAADGVSRRDRRS
jgi:hypothetical protein